MSETTRVSGVMSAPCSRRSAISEIRCVGSMTTPLPMTDSFPGRTMPDGSSDSLYSTPPMTSVWPALCPPWKRTTTSARLESQSTILPLPSSPHWAPITATFVMLIPAFGDGHGNARAPQRAAPRNGDSDSQKTRSRQGEVGRIADLRRNAEGRPAPPAPAREARPSHRRRSAGRSRQARWPRRPPRAAPDGRSRC